MRGIFKVGEQAHTSVYNTSMKKQLVTFGFVNCNRLHYLESCFKSFLHCTSDYSDKEVIFVDNASSEPGTKEFFDYAQGACEELGIRFVSKLNTERDPANEFAKGLNFIVENAHGEFIIPLQSDMQFILTSGWLGKYVEVMNRHEFVGCIMLDAQRRVTNSGHQYSNEINIDGFRFQVDFSRSSACAAGDVMYRKSILQSLGPWSEDNRAHEGGQDSETDMLERFNAADDKLYTIVPMFPVSIAIYTDTRGTNARVRGNKRYGNYFPGNIKDSAYYKMFSYEDSSDLVEHFALEYPVPIEDVAVSVVRGFDLPIDSNGAWKKNPIRPELAKPGEWTEV
jgi:hypothetical protein